MFVVVAVVVVVVVVVVVIVVVVVVVVVVGVVVVVVGVAGVGVGVVVAGVGVDEGVHVTVIGASAPYTESYPNPYFHVVTSPGQPTSVTALLNLVSKPSKTIHPGTGVE